MRHFPSPPIVSAAFTGFVAGIVLTLIVTGAFAVKSKGQPAPVSLATPISDPQVYARVRRLIVQELGAATYPAAREARLSSLTIVPAGPERIALDAGSRQPRFRSVYVQFRLNDHPLGRFWRFRAAKGDVFGVLKALYTSRLGIYNVEMDGSFPLVKGKPASARTVLIAKMNHAVAEKIAWDRLPRKAETEARIWSLLPYRIVDRRFV